jgi:hypothetical protein
VLVQLKAQANRHALPCLFKSAHITSFQADSAALVPASAGPTQYSTLYTDTAQRGASIPSQSSGGMRMMFGKPIRT